jgi:hypothetical protein
MDLFDLIGTQLSDDVIGRLATSLGESPQATRQATSAGAIPAILGSLVQRYSGDAGASQLLNLLRSGGHDGSILNNLGGALGGGAQTDALLNVGKGLLGSLLGDRSDAVTDLLASTSGLRRSSAGSLLGLAVPLVLGVLGKQVQSRGIGAAGIATALAALPDALGKVAAPGLATAMGLSGFAAPPPPGEGRKAAIWPWLLVPAVALTLFFGLQRCQQTAAAPPARPADPGAAAASAPSETDVIRSLPGAPSAGMPAEPAPAAATPSSADAPADAPPPGSDEATPPAEPAGESPRPAG